MMERRKFLTLTGGGIVVAAGMGIGGFATTRTPHRALAPWTDAGSLYSEPRKKALSYAILAPNPHNRQPWKIDLSQPDIIKIFVDTERLLVHTDPFSRQITIGFGCFLELLRMAAAQDGYRVEEQLFPEGASDRHLDQRPIATIKFFADGEVKADALFTHVLERRSLKDPYDTTKPITDEHLVALEKLVAARHSLGSTRDPARVRALRKFTRKAMAIEIDTPHTYEESVNLFRIGKKQIEANPDGISFSGAFFEALALAGMFTREIALDRSSSGFAQGIKVINDSMETAMGYMWLVSKTNTRQDQVLAGRDWVRMNLAATRLGIATQPLSQALQEYPEMELMYKKAHDIFAPQGGTVQMLARLGFGKDVQPSPRWALSKKIIKG